MAKRRKSIYECQAFLNLKELAENPFDMTVEGALDSERLETFVCKGIEFDLLYGCQRVTTDVLDCLQSLADECGLVGQYEEMRAGAVMNRIERYPSEERQVLHTACRDVFSKTAANDAAVIQVKRELAKLQEFLAEIDNGKIRNTAGETFTSLIHVGIGGSDLGPRSIYEALKAYGRKDRKVYFVSNVDPDDSAAVLDRVDLSKTLVLVVSKSGSTLETLSNESLVRNALKEAGLDPARHCLAVTGESSPMDNHERYLRSFYMFDYIGGRFSSTSMVGAVTLGFALGYNQVLEFLKGAWLMDEAAAERNIRGNIPLLLAMLGVWNHNFLAMDTVAILPYSQGLHRFPAHLQQCDMESNGKSVQRNGEPVRYKSGPIVWGEPGTNGQHAFYQLLHQGTEKVAVEFIGFRKSQRNRDMCIQGSNSQQKLLANLLAQSLALAVGREDENPNKNFAGNRSNVILMGERLTPKSMGALLALYEAKIVFQGFCWNVNSFDQEGVQLGKVLADEILGAMAEKRNGKTLAEALLAVAGIS
ncbi:glucose-6-phosphate isomerase [Desulfocapsa sulfexigens DSM 10523]|uniref:Glucose-6-phosphate isomerase n=1 Tax=Desulfocapsa sulfexigens (strain DSM 10523 / SB164P1) TaxID=1167006 RepID=M1PEP7_DESSD|nr:glucose-6-phosphate isomerase [Desulfocapsa sulfexigens]AGF78190.1 glucose-6-phosphate isomerase [Desulfocapsa sulfexigens DSM 10523]